MFSLGNFKETSSVRVFIAHAEHFREQTCIFLLRMSNCSRKDFVKFRYKKLQSFPYSWEQSEKRVFVFHEWQNPELSRGYAYFQKALLIFRNRYGRTVTVGMYVLHELPAQVDRITIMQEPIFYETHQPPQWQVCCWRRQTAPWGHGRWSTGVFHMCMTSWCAPVHPGLHWPGWWAAQHTQQTNHTTVEQICVKYSGIFNMTLPHSWKTNWLSRPVSPDTPPFSFPHQFPHPWPTFSKDILFTFIFWWGRVCEHKHMHACVWRVPVLSLTILSSSNIKLLSDYTVPACQN